MKKENRSYKMYLEDIHLAMDRIAEYIEGYTFIKFKQDYKTVDAVIRNFEIIGEAAKNLPEDFKTIHSDLPWPTVPIVLFRVQRSALIAAVRLSVYR
jgi:uncharacterized protein with HEPN domain